LGIKNKDESKNIKIQSQNMGDRDCRDFWGNKDSADERYNKDSADDKNNNDSADERYDKDSADDKNNKDSEDDKYGKDSEDDKYGKDSEDDKYTIDDFDKNILACRCMEIAEQAVREAIRQGATTVDAVKRATMAGMGLCQSKICFNIIARLISEETDTPVSQIRPMRIRIPVRPVKIKSLDVEI